MSYCPKCGNEVKEDDEYCSKCRANLKSNVSYRKVKRRSNFEWKDPDEELYGALIGGGVVIWLGTLLMLQNQGMLGGGDFGGFFLLGIGIILVLRGFIAYWQTEGYDKAFGFLAGGGIMMLIGAGIAYNIRDWWAFLLIGLGLIIVGRVLINRK
jgi:predicted nucleic acid-binding Zn ribbon protein